MYIGFQEEIGGFHIQLSPNIQIVLQPHGCFVADFNHNKFHTLNETLSAILLSFDEYNPSVQVGNWFEENTKISTKQFNDSLQYLQEQQLIADLPHPEAPNISGDTELLSIVRAEIEITNRCNLRCVYCYAMANSSQKELDLETWIEILDSMYKFGLRTVLFSGGEPTMYPKFKQLLEYCEDKFIVEINTNGRFVDDELIEIIQRSHIKIVQISLDSMKPEHHDSLRGKKSHHYAIQAIEKLRMANIPVQLYMVVTQENQNQISEMREYATSMGCRFNARPVNRTGFARDIDDEEWENRFVVDDNPHHSFKTDLDTFTPLCQSMSGYVSVSHLGTLKPCNLRENFFEDATDQILLNDAKSKWWERRFGEHDTASILTKVNFVSDDTISEIRNTSPVSMCGLQAAVISIHKSNPSNSTKHLPMASQQ